MGRPRRLAGGRAFRLDRARAAPDERTPTRGRAHEWSIRDAEAGESVLRASGTEVGGDGLDYVVPLRPDGSTSCFLVLALGGRPSRKLTLALEACSADLETAFAAAPAAAEKEPDELPRPGRPRATVPPAEPASRTRLCRPSRRSAEPAGRRPLPARLDGSGRTRDPDSDLQPPGRRVRAARSRSFTSRAMSSCWVRGGQLARARARPGAARPRRERDRDPREPRAHAGLTRSGPDQRPLTGRARERLRRPRALGFLGDVSPCPPSSSRKRVLDRRHPDRIGMILFVVLVSIPRMRAGVRGFAAPGPLRTPNYRALAAASSSRTRATGSR